MVRLPAFATNPTTRLVKSPKIYWRDVGLASHLTGRRRLSDVDGAGALLENLVLVGMLAWRETVYPRPEITYFRTVAGAEVDFVIEHGARLLPSRSSPPPRSRRTTRVTSSASSTTTESARHGACCSTNGEAPRRLTRRVVALPVTPWT